MQKQTDTSLMPANTGVPRGWFKAGSHPGQYEMKVDREVFHGGKAAARLRLSAKRRSGFGTLMQSVAADRYRGKRIRLSAFIKAQDATLGGLWLRIDSSDGRTLAFDNMEERGGITGTRDWETSVVVLPVPEESASIHFGLLLGSGTLWMDDLSLEIVGEDVPITAQSPTFPAQPQNLDFEEGS